MKWKTAEEMGFEQREISVAEFFERNRHLLGYDNPAKALLTVVKEAVDNSLDASDEAGILPKIMIKIREMGENRYEVLVKDNGPGILSKQVPRIFGKLLYGSKFHKLRQSRGQQGMGISSAVLYSQLTTNKPITIKSKVRGQGKAHLYKLKIDIMRNEPHVLEHEVVNDGFERSGVLIKMLIEGKHMQRYHSVDEYLKQVAIVNPHAHIIYDMPSGERTVFSRVSRKLPKRTLDIKPHPHGIEIGILGRMLKASKAKTLNAFLRTEFCKIGNITAREICRIAKLDGNLSPSLLSHREQEKLMHAMRSVKLLRPPTNCLSPIGEKLIYNGLAKEINVDFIATISRDPAVYRGNPFVVEAGIAYGGELDPEKPVKLMRFANKVPLLYQQSDCVITKTISSIKWSRYGLSQPGGSGLPRGPAIFLVHICSTWVPFTSESKEAVASYPEIQREVRLAILECARQVLSFIRRQRRAKREKYRMQRFMDYLPLIAESACKLAGRKKKIDINPVLNLVVKKRLLHVKNSE